MLCTKFWKVKKSVSAKQIDVHIWVMLDLHIKGENNIHTSYPQLRKIKLQDLRHERARNDLHSLMLEICRNINNVLVRQLKYNIYTRCRRSGLIYEGDTLSTTISMAQSPKDQECWLTLLGFHIEFLNSFFPSILSKQIDYFL